MFRRDLIICFFYLNLIQSLIPKNDKNFETTPFATPLTIPGTFYK